MSKKVTALKNRIAFIQGEGLWSQPFKLYRLWRLVLFFVLSGWHLIRRKKSFRWRDKNGAYSTERFSCYWATTYAIREGWTEDEIHSHIIFDPPCRDHKWIPKGEITRTFPPSSEAICLRCGDVHIFPEDKFRSSK